VRTHHIPQTVFFSCNKALPCYRLPEALPRHDFLMHEAEPHPIHYPAEPGDEVMRAMAMSITSDPLGFRFQIAFHQGFHRLLGGNLLIQQ